MNSNQEHGGQQARERLLSSWMVFLCRCLQLLKTRSLYSKLNAPRTVETVIDRRSQSLQYLEARLKALDIQSSRGRGSQRPDGGQLHGQGQPRAHRVSGCGAATPWWLLPLTPPAPPLPHGLSTNPGLLLFQLPPYTAGQPGVLRHLCAPPQAIHLCLKAASQKGQPSSLLWPGSHPAFVFSWHQSPTSTPLITTVSSSQCSAPSLQNPRSAQALSIDMAVMVKWVRLARSTRWAGVAWCHWMLNFCKSLVWFPKHQATLQ